MKKGANGASEDRKKIAAVVGFLLIAGVVLYFELGGDSVPAPSAPIAVTTVTPSEGSIPSDTESAAAAAPGRDARTVGRTSASFDPTLHMDGMMAAESVVYSGSGRNIFSTNSTPSVTIPNPIAGARMKAGVKPVVLPCPPNCPPPPPPPPPPAIDLKFFGVGTSPSGLKQAFLLHGDSVFLASVGDIVMRRYRVVSIAEKSIQMEDMLYKDTQALPLLAN